MTTKLGLNSQDISNILDMVAQNDVSAVIAQTGSGKSTYLVEEIYKANYRIFVVQPTIPSVYNLYTFMSQKLGSIVGYASEGHAHYNNSSKIVYCTSGHMKNIFLGLIKKVEEGLPLKFCDVIMLDESHNGSLDLEIIMTLWKLLSSNEKIIPKLVLASATLSMDSIPFPNCKFYNVHVDSFEIDIIYHHKTYNLGDDLKKLYHDTLEKVITIHQQLEMVDPSTWLIFCPGSHEVETIFFGLKSLDDPNLIVVKSYAGSNDNVSDIFIEPAFGQRKIIIATNIAETSITINNLSIIFDTMTEKYAETATSGGFKLSLNYISKSSAAQRAGRTGRTCKGTVYRMCTHEFFESLVEQRPKEIDRIPLYNMVIEILEVGLDPSEIFEIESAKLSYTANVLSQLSMINSDGVTDIGKFGCMFPISVHNSLLLYHWLNRGLPIFVGICCVSIINSFGPSYFYYPKKVGMAYSELNAFIQGYYEQHFSKYQHSTDIGTFINMLLSILDYINYDLSNKKSITEYCVANSLNNKKVIEMINTIHRLITIFTNQGYNMVMGPFQTEVAIVSLTPLLILSYPDNVFIRLRQQTYRNKQKGQYTLDNKFSISNSEIPLKLIALITADIQTATHSTKKYISFYHPIQ